MKNNELIETPGYFWLPETPDEKIPGILRVSEFGETSVDLLKILGDYESEVNQIINKGHKGIDRICGIVRQGGYLTLIDCHYQSVNLRLGMSLDTAIINAQTAFIGADFKQSEITFKEYDFWAEGLGEWLAMSGITTTTDLSTASGTIEYHQLEPITHNLPDGITLKFAFASSGPSSLSVYPPTDVRVTQKPYMSLSSTEPKTIDYFHSLAIKLIGFLSLVVDQEVQIQSINIFPEQEAADEGSVYSFPVRVYRNFPPNSRGEAKIDQHKILFSYATINNFDEMISKWLENYDIATFASALDQYFASKSIFPMSLTTRFLYLCQGVEVLHRRMFPKERTIPNQDFKEIISQITNSLPDDCPEFIKNKLNSANQLSLRDRIERMMKPFEEWFKVNETSKEFAKRVADTRNHLTHLHGRQEQQATSGQELWDLYNKLEILTTLYVLMLLGLDKNDITPIVQHAPNRLNQELRITTEN